MRVVQLDALRAIAVLLVLGHHMPACPRDLNYPLALFTEQWKQCGWAGVDLFFVLSGFLVSGLLFREYQKYGTIKLPRFLARRGLKIYPAFYVLLLTTIAVYVVTGRTLERGAVLA